MQPFTKLTGIVAPLDRPNVDTDQIIPKQFLKRIERTGFGQFLFFDWRFLPDGTPNPAFELNDAAYKGAGILVAGRNFGSGSSREHAPWALMDYGFRVVIAPSLADIFRNNCLQNGLLPLIVPEDVVAAIMTKAKAKKGYRLTVDLEAQVLRDSDGFEAPFQIDAFRRHCLLNGLDDIGLTMQHETKITAYERAHGLSSTSR
ncbi:MAG: 3-isopropylmalate dehydratase small subunit [Dehalococcoidia bacterium]|nr:3-isopropylmalate dehydratase small subunit [Dehalococcoidia bacterium]